MGRPRSPTSTRKVRSDHRPVAPDFAARCPTMSLRALCRHYGSSMPTIRRWCREAGVKPLASKTSMRRGVPADFVAIAPTMTRRQLTKHYETGARLIERWIQQSGAVPKFGTRCDARSLPDDFADTAARYCASQLCQHYTAGTATIKRWSKEAGVIPPGGNRGRPGVRGPKPINARTIRPAAHRGPSVPFSSLRRDVSTGGLAADHLRHWQPVYRCTERGGVPERAVPNDPRLTHWRCGNAVMTGAELIERARAKGWSPDAWRHLAPANDTERQRMAQREA